MANLYSLRAARSLKHLPLGFQLGHIRHYHNAQKHPETLTVLEFPKKLGDAVALATTNYIKHEEMVTSGIARWKTHHETAQMPARIYNAAWKIYLEKPSTDKETKNLEDFHRTTEKFVAGNIPAYLLTGLPVKPIPATEHHHINAFKEHKDYRYNIILQEVLMLGLFGLTLFSSIARPTAITLTKEPRGSFRSEDGLGFHIDGARNANSIEPIAEVASLLCVNGGDAITKIAGAAQLFNALTPTTQQALLRPTCVYQEVHDWGGDGEMFAPFLRHPKTGTTGVQFTAEHKSMRGPTKSLEEFHGLLDHLERTPDSTAEVVSQSGYLLTTLNAAHRESNPSQILANSLHMRKPSVGHRLVVRQHYNLPKLGTSPSFTGRG